MKRNLLTITLTLITLLFYTSKSFAVDGYKNITFGMTANQVLSNNICSFKKQNPVVEGADFYLCGDFDFNGQQIEGGFFTINGKFQRFYFSVPVDSALAVINSLVSKYGQPSSRSTQEEFETVDRLPNKKAFYGFDNDTVYFQIHSQADMSQLAIVIYTNPNYDRLLAEAASEKISDLF
jgi:hypothetical protein